VSCGQEKKKSTRLQSSSAETKSNCTGMVLGAAAVAISGMLTWFPENREAVMEQHVFPAQKHSSVLDPPCYLPQHFAVDEQHCTSATHCQYMEPTAATHHLGPLLS